MRFYLVLLNLVLMVAGALPVFGNPVYVHVRTRKAKRHKVPKHRTVQQ